MKKTLSVILSLLMVFSVMTVAPLTAGAATRYTYGDWEYEVWSIYDSATYEIHEEICITNYTGDGEKVTIPNEIDGKPVTYLYNNYVFGNVDHNDKDGRHFANFEKMTELTIPENLKYIAGFMLMDCEKLYTINVSPNNKYFEFKQGVLYMKDGTKTWGDHVSYHNGDIPDEYGPVFARFNMGVVNLPTYNTTIYEYAFYNHAKLQNVVMTLAAGKMKKIEDYAFYNSGIRGEQDIFGYTSVSIPWGVTEIGYSAFMNCKNLYSVHFPETLKKIDIQAFLETGCVNFHLPSSLEEVGRQAFGYSGDKVNIYANAAVKKLVEDVTHYEQNNDASFTPAGGGQAIQLNHDPANPASHIYTNSVTIPPTCTSAGLTVLMCSCGFQYYNESSVIQPSGHNWTEKKVYSTCFEQGYTLHTCKNCGETYKDNYTKVRNHYKVTIPAVEPTATKAGSTEGLYCDMCGTVFTQPKLIPPTGYTEKEDNGVKITAEPDATPKVSEVTDESVIQDIDLGEDKKADKVYDIKLEKDGETVQPEGDVVVSIPSDTENAEVFRVEEDGALTNMDAYYEDGAYNFKSDHFSLYVIATEAVKEYKLWVNNEQITSEHLTVECGEGTATFDPKETTLTLNNAQITQGAEKDYLGTGILDFLDEELTIIIKGDCSITETNGDGIGSYEFDDDYQMVPHDITVKGDGKLTITESTPLYGYGFYCTGKLKLDGVDIDINSAATGVWTNNALTVQNSTLNINCTTKFSGFVVNNGSAVFEKSKVTAESAEGVGILLGNDQNSSAVMVNSGTVTLKGKGGVGADTEHSRVCVVGGKLIIEAQEKAFSPEILDNEGNIVFGEGVEVLSGDMNSASVTIGSTIEPVTETVTETVTESQPTESETVTAQPSATTTETDTEPVETTTEPITETSAPTESTEPAEDTSAATEVQTTEAQATETATSASDSEPITMPVESHILSFVPVDEQADSFKLVIEDTNNNLHSYDMLLSDKEIDGFTVYTVTAETDYDIALVHFQMYKGETWIGQVTKTAAQLAEIEGKIVKGDGTVINPTDATETNTENTSETVTETESSTAQATETTETYMPTDSTETQPTTAAPTKTVTKKKANPIKVTAKKKTVKLKKLKKKKQKVKALTVKKAQGKVTYKLVKSGISKKIRKLVKISKKGVITIKKWKKAKKGTYKIKVTIKAAGNAKYKSKKLTKKVKVKIK